MSVPSCTHILKTRRLEDTVHLLHKDSFCIFVPGCGGLLHVDRGTVSSPRYPQNYSPHLNCSWHVMVTPGFRVSATFQSPFQVQGYGTQCSSGDYLEVTFKVY